MMPSSKYLEACPVFPSDVAIADIPTISLRRLEQPDDEDEAKKLFDACRQHGFFLLALHDSPEGSTLLKDAESMFDLTAETLDLDKTVLQQYAYRPPKDLTGYKEAGKLKTDDGKLDATEMYTLAQDDLLGRAPRAHPDPIERRRSECREFCTRAYGTIAVILGALDVRLGLPKGTLADLSSLDRASATSLRLLLTRPGNAQAEPTLPTRVTLGAHTDMGLISILFHVAGGLQILPADCENTNENWRYIRPKPGYALVNLGDTLVEWTGGVLRSALHRVVTAPGKQSSTTRISIAYLIRAARGETMKRLNGKAIPTVAEGEEDTRDADEWAAERAQQIINGILKPRTYGGVPMSVH